MPVKIYTKKIRVKKKMETQIIRNLIQTGQSLK